MQSLKESEDDFVKKKKKASREKHISSELQLRIKIARFSKSSAGF